MIRLFDFVFSIFGLVLLFPLFLIIILILKFTGEGEIFFKQKRIGKDFQEFHLFKFATMLRDSPNIGTGTVTVKDDPRVLPFGKLLRKTKINEAPQLFNVLMGNMSLVGPRPQALRNFKSFPEELKEALVSVKPGLSGLGSIVFRSEENILHSNSANDFYNKIIMPYKAQIENFYISKIGLTSYLKIIILTVLVIITDKGSLAKVFFPDMPDAPEELKKFL